MTPNPATVEVPESASGKRLDAFLAGHLADLSRARVHALIDSGAVTFGGQPVRASRKLRAGEVYSVSVPPPSETGLLAEHIPLQIVYEDSDLLVVDKPAGLVVHPAPGHPTGTLVNAVLAHCPDIEGIGGELRPGIVHRLDKDTSGLLVVAKNERAHRHLAAQLKERLMDKRYAALVSGTPGSETGTIHAPLARDPRRAQRMAVVAGGREAVTHFRVVERFSRFSLLECKPVTGRTHQIRVHLTSIGCPVVGDRVYGRPTPQLVLERHFLHAQRLTFTLLSGEERTFHAPLPPDLVATIEQLRQR